MTALAQFANQASAEALADEHGSARVTSNGVTIYEVSLLDQPTDTEVADALALLELKPHHAPEGHASWNGSAVVRLPKLPIKAMSAAEARAWAELLLRAADDADACVEEQARAAEHDAFVGEREEAS